MRNGSLRASGGTWFWIWLNLGLAVVVRSSLAASVELDPQQSHIDVAVKATGDSFVAHLEKYDAQIVIDPASLKPEQAVFRWDFQDLKTGKAKRDRAMLDWLEHTKIPKATFTLKQWQTAEGKTTAVGELDLHGVKKEIRFPAQIERRDDNQLVIRGETELNHLDYGLKKITMMLFFKVDPVLKVSFELRGKVRS